MRFAQEFNTLRANEMGARVDLLTTQKTTLVAAINEIWGILAGDLPDPGSVINDDVTGLSTTWSSAKLAGKFSALPPAGAQIDDINPSDTTVWSSNKTKAMIDESAGAKIDDGASAADTTWSSQKIQQVVDAAGGGDGAIIDDEDIQTDKVWSSFKTSEAIAQALASVPAYVLPVASATVLGGVKVGQYLAIDGNGVLRVVIAKADIGLGNVDNTADANKPVSTAQQTAINNAVAGVTKTSLGLANVDNTSDMNKPVSTAQANAIDSAVLGINKAWVGLGNVDNTSDVNKPVSTAQAAADTATLNSAKSYAESLVVGLWDDRGSYDASTNLFPSTGGSGTSGAILKGDIWTISVAGTLGGTAVAQNQTVRAMIDAPGQVAGNWAISLSGMAMIDDSITDGIVGRAPSQNAVFDALALKQPLLSAGSNAQVRLGDNSLATANKALVGLANVDNTSDVNKPVSTAQTAAITAAVNAVVKTAVKNEGTALTSDVSEINFVGAGVNATVAGSVVTVTIDGGGSEITSTDQLAEGSTNLYYTDARTRAAFLTGLNTGINASVVAGDTVLGGIGKLQAQASANAVAISGINKNSLGLGNVENKSAATILGELTGAQVNTSLGYTAGRVVTALDEGGALASGAAVQSINFVGSGVTATQTGGAVTITVPGSSGPASTDALAEGTTNLYFTGARVLSAILTGLNLTVSTAVTAADSVLTAIGKLQKQITDLALSAVTLTGVATLTNKTLTSPVINGATLRGYTEDGPASVTAGATIALTFSETDVEYVITQNVTLQWPAPIAGKTLTVKLTQGGAGNWTVSHTIVSGALKASGGVYPVTTLAAGKADFYIGKCNRAATEVCVFDGGRNF